MDKRAGQSQPLLHAPAQGVDLGLATIGEVDQLQKLARDRRPLAPRHAVAGGVELEVLGGGQPVVDAEEVGHVADQVADLARILGDRDAGHGGVAGVGRAQRGQDPDGGRLARPVGTDEAEDLALGDGEGDLVQGDPAPELLVEALDRDHGLATDTPCR